jgi:hypothetical protein
MSINSKAKYRRQVLALNDSELEAFVREWVGCKKSIYEEVTSFGGSGDLGRDVAGFLSKEKHEGDWHNYQCKQYKTSLPTDKSLLELGKILYYAHQGEFTAPEKYIFVAPKGANRNLESLVFNPSKLQRILVQEWDKYCGLNGIIANKHIVLTDELRSFICSYDFSKVSIMNLESILIDENINPVLFNWFGADPGPAPKGKPPKEIDKREMVYIYQLVDAYGDRDGCEYSSVKELIDKSGHFNHLARQRERFFDADAFKRFYRDNTDNEEILGFVDDIYHGVVDTSEANHEDALCCLESVMSKAASISPSGILQKHARVTVKQGVCHHLANEERLKWKK